MSNFSNVKDTRKGFDFSRFMSLFICLFLVYFIIQQIYKFVHYFYTFWSSNIDMFNMIGFNNAVQILIKTLPSNFCFALLLTPCVAFVASRFWKRDYANIMIVTIVMHCFIFVCFLIYSGWITGHMDRLLSVVLTSLYLRFFLSNLFVSLLGVLIGYSVWLKIFARRKGSAADHNIAKKRQSVIKR